MKNLKNTDLNETLGNVPPQAIELEENVLASIMIEPEKLFDIMDTLTPEMFYKDMHAKIYAFMVNAQQNGKSYEYVSVGRFLRESNFMESTMWLSDITSRIVSTQMIEKHALAIKEKYVLREYLRIFYEGSMMVYNGDDLEDVAEKAGQSIMKLMGCTEKKEAKQIGIPIDKIIEQINKIQKNEISLIGVPSGFTELDRITGGWKNGELIIVAARPSMGKTAFALQAAINSCELSYPTCFFSLEMSEMEMARRCVSSATGVTNTQLISGNCMGMDALLDLTSGIAKVPLYIDDTSALTLMEIRAKARRLILKYGIKLFVVDYLQIMGGVNKKGQSREQEVSEFSRGLKSIAKDLDVPFIVLSQLNRECESRPDKKPRLSDLRDSGAIEQDADMVLLLSRPAKYGINAIECADGTSIDSRGIMVVDVAKNRNGAISEIFLEHNKPLTTIFDYGQALSEPTYQENNIKPSFTDF